MTVFNAGVFSTFRLVFTICDLRSDVELLVHSPLSVAPDGELPVTTGKSCLTREPRINFLLFLRSTATSIGHRCSVCDVRGVRSESDAWQSEPNGDGKRTWACSNGHWRWPWLAPSSSTVSSSSPIPQSDSLKLTPHLPFITSDSTTSSLYAITFSARRGHQQHVWIGDAIPIEGCCKLRPGRMKPTVERRLRLESDATPTHTTAILHWLLIALSTRIAPSQSFSVLSQRSLFRP